MNFKIYQSFIIKKYLINIISLSGVFLILSFIMNILEEIKFFSNYEVEFYLPIVLTLLNIPGVIYQIFPFIILLSIFSLVSNFIENNELQTFKTNGLSNFSMVKIITITSFFVGLFIVVVFYNLSAKFKTSYLSIKKNFTEDDQYLAAITENGLWIKDEIDNETIIFVNAQSINSNELIDVDITFLDNDFKYLKSLSSKKIDIRSTNWIINNPLIINDENINTNDKQMILKTNFNYTKINNLYSDLSALTIWGLFKLRDDYLDVGYSTTEIDYQLHKIFSHPINIMIISILSLVLIMNFKIINNKFHVIVLGVFISVIIYYINHFFGVIGKSEKIPLVQSVWIPLLVLFLFSIIGMVKINEK